MITDCNKDPDNGHPVEDIPLGGCVYCMLETAEHQRKKLDEILSNIDNELATLEGETHGQVNDAIFKIRQMIRGVEE